MTRVLPAITCVFVGIVATLVSSCARDCVAPEAVYAQRPSAGVDYGSGPGAQPSGPPPGSYPYGPPSRRATIRAASRLVPIWATSRYLLKLRAHTRRRVRICA